MMSLKTTPVPGAERAEGGKMEEWGGTLANSPPVVCHGAASTITAFASP